MTAADRCAVIFPVSKKRSFLSCSKKKSGKGDWYIIIKDKGYMPLQYLIYVSGSEADAARIRGGTQHVLL